MTIYSTTLIIFLNICLVPVEDKWETRTLGLLPSILITSDEKQHLTGRWSLVLSFLQYKFPCIYRSLSDSDSKLDLPKTQPIKPLPWLVTLGRWSHYLTASSSCHEAAPTAGYQPPSWIPAFRLEIELCGALCQSITFCICQSLICSLS